MLHPPFVQKWGPRPSSHLPHAQGWVRGGSGPPLIAHHRPPHGANHQKEMATSRSQQLYSGVSPPSRVPVPACTHPLASQYCCPPRRVSPAAPAPSPRSPAGESRAVPTSPARCEAVVTVTSPQPPWCSWKGGTDQRVPSSPKSLVPPNLPFLPQPCAPNSPSPAAAPSPLSSLSWPPSPGTSSARLAAAGGLAEAAPGPSPGHFSGGEEGEKLPRDLLAEPQALGLHL